jgi:ribosomal protein L37E
MTISKYFYKRRFIEALQELKYCAQKLTDEETKKEQAIDNYIICLKCTYNTYDKNKNICTYCGHVGS